MPAKPAKRIASVGILGLGRMGRPIAGHLVTAGYEVAGFDPDRTATAAAVAGLRPAGSAAEVARLCALTVVIVGFEAQVEEAVFGPDGAIAGAAEGAIVAIASTVAPSYMQSLSGRLRTHGVHLLDIPLTRGEAAARDGTLIAFAGGEAEILDRCRPALDTFCEQVIRLGGIGAGQTGKAVNNLLLWSCVCANVEGLELAAALGVDREALRDALRFGSGANWALATRAEERPALWAEKDMTIVLSEAARAGVAMPVSGAVGDAIRAFKAARGLPAPSAG